MRLSSGFAAVALLAFLAGCATPEAIKEATVVLDDGYRDNLKMIRAYEKLVGQINERHELWWKYSRRRVLLKLALEAATTDNSVVDKTINRAVADESFNRLGSELVQQVNRVRLTGLPERRGSDGTIIFEAGRPARSFAGIAQAIPALVNAIDKQVDKEYTSLITDDETGFKAYKTNISALRRINATVQRYLDVDVTLNPEDVYSLSSTAGRED